MHLSRQASCQQTLVTASQLTIRLTKATAPAGCGSAFSHLVRQVNMALGAFSAIGAARPFTTRMRAIR
ncbi:hypothetical protein WL37_11425 [Burkholderia ubonensis]|nr:hypothetical protein WL37_11425 [Burkholderia ubonensis]